jgi:hypothetical protein
MLMRKIFWEELGAYKNIRNSPGSLFVVVKGQKIQQLGMTLKHISTIQTTSWKSGKNELMQLNMKQRHI